MNPLIISIRKELKASADKKTWESGQRFFKEPLLAYGVKIPAVKAISKRYTQEIKGLGKRGVFELCEVLWQSGYIEEAMIACHWSYAVRKDFVPDDFKTFKKWITNYVSNWATCDTFCNHTVGVFLEMYPDQLDSLVKFSVSKNMWLRRAAAVSMIVPARKGMFLETIFKIADKLLEDKEDLVQKGYGWMLKETCKKHQPEVFKYVMTNKSKMPRTALRYAIEKMSKEMKDQAMVKQTN